MKIIVELDCSEALELIKLGTPNTSRYVVRVQEYREMSRVREMSFTKIICDTNRVSNDLARWVEFRNILTFGYGVFPWKSPNTSVLKLIYNHISP
jgi:hypothetical protein